MLTWIETGIGCEYLRQKKKRGKASKKDLAQRATSSSDAKYDGEPGSLVDELDQGRIEQPRNGSVDSTRNEQSQKGSDFPTSANDDNQATDEGPSHRDEAAAQRENLCITDAHPLDHAMTMDVDGSESTSRTYERNNSNGNIYVDHVYGAGGQKPLPGYTHLPSGAQGPSPPSYGSSQTFGLGNSPLDYTIANGTGTGWGVSMPSPGDQFPSPLPQYRFNNIIIKYPVLVPLVPHLNNIIPISLACDLIDVYFASSSSAQMHPMSPYVLGFLVRKASFLHTTNPRSCQPSLLASILWVAAQTSDASLLSSSPSARRKICKKLLELTVGLLRPLIHAIPGDMSAGSSPSADGVALGGLGVAMPGTVSMEALTGESGPFGAAGNLDDVITYIHLATVVSASEYKGASLRWWNSAWSLARELKLGRELPPSPPNIDNGSDLGGGPIGLRDGHRTPGAHITDEEREERRRTWWLAYTVDRHLALCYNRPLFLLDVECFGLLQPMDEKKWQAGDFTPQPSYNNDTNYGNPSFGHDPVDDMPRGPRFECRGHSIFGYFLPLMTILGEIVDLHHSKNHPRFGIGFRAPHEWENQALEIEQHLEVYRQSLTNFEQNCLQQAAEGQANQVAETNQVISDSHDVSLMFPTLASKSRRMTESEIQTRIVIAYGTHVMHVLHILLTGKWDPINLLDDNDLWISSEGFVTATSHAVAAAEAISQILEFDPGLEFMPFFFGIYLLQGSFLLLLIADKLQSEASPSVVKACETIVRAHEACVVTLNTEYQVSKETMSSNYSTTRYLTCL